MNELAKLRFAAVVWQTKESKYKRKNYYLYPNKRTAYKTYET
jgi:hypothetical protein